MDYIKENEFVKKSFLEHFSNNGYFIESSVALNSRVDDSVFLIGSCTNVFKQYFLTDSIKKEGHVLMQPCINSKYTEQLYSNVMSRYGSSYITLGLLARYDSLHQLIRLALEYLHFCLGFSKESIEIKVHGLDYDFMHAMDNLLTGERVSLVSGDSCRNHFGKTSNGDEIKGRTIRINIINKETNMSNNIMGISIFELNNQILGIELSTTVSVINIERFGLDNTMQVSVLNQIRRATTSEELKYYECISVIANLLRDNIVPNSTKMDGRIFKGFNRALAHLSTQNGMELSNSVDYIIKYILMEYNNVMNLSNEKLLSLISRI